MVDGVSGMSLSVAADGVSEMSLSDALEHSVCIDDMAVCTLDIRIPNLPDGIGSMATGDDTIRNTDSLEGGADMSNAITSTDGEVVEDAGEEEDADPDWSSYYSDEEDEEDDYVEGGYNDREESIFYSDSERDSDSLDDFEINDSVRRVMKLRRKMLSAG